MGWKQDEQSFLTIMATCSSDHEIARMEVWSHFPSTLYEVLRDLIQQRNFGRGSRTRPYLREAGYMEEEKHNENYVFFSEVVDFGFPPPYHAGNISMGCRLVMESKSMCAITRIYEHAVRCYDGRDGCFTVCFGLLR